MELEIIVTDLTRLNNNGKLCIAGIGTDDSACVRPLIQKNDETPHYLDYDICKAKNLLPGVVLKGIFNDRWQAEAPHVEDLTTPKLEIVRRCDPIEFKAVLQNSAYGDVASGFGVTEVSGKVILPEQHPVRSLITISPVAGSFELVPDGYTPNKLRANFKDRSNKNFKFIPVKDLGILENLGNPEARRISLDDINEFWRDQETMYIRLGIGRVFDIGGTNGYWLQVNGVYTFPDFHKSIRTY